MVCWENKASSPTRAVMDANSFLAEWLSAKCLPRSAAASGGCGKWHRPQQGSFKINVEAAQFLDLHQSGAGMIVRDEKGCFIVVRVIRYAGDIRADEAKVIGIHEALTWIKELGFHSIELETDAKIVAEAINDNIVILLLLGIIFVHALGFAINSLFVLFVMCLEMPILWRTLLIGLRGLS